MTQPELDRVIDLKLREIWNDEAKVFTPWLVEHIDVLGEAIGLNLIEPDREVEVGPFSCDIKCKVEEDKRIVVIENQIEPSDHEHLGKAIVYASGLGASVVIWIVRQAREEHSSAIEWLNEHSDSNIFFFLLEIRAIKIGDSKPAPLFKVIQQPDNYVKTIKGNETKKLTRAQIGRYNFWTELNSYIEDSDYNLSTHKPSYETWYTFAIGSSKYLIEVNLIDISNRIRVGILIHDDKTVFDKLNEHEAQIKSKLNFELEWERKDDIKSSSISSYISGFSYDDDSNYNELIKEICERVIALKRVVNEVLGKAKKKNNS